MKTPTLKTSVIAAGIIAVFVFSGLALAQGPGAGKSAGRGPGAQAWCDGNGPGGGRGIERLAQRLDLSDDQVKAITDLQEQSRTKNLALRKDMMRLRNELQGEMLKDSPDVKTVKNLAAKMGDLRTTMQQNRLETRLAVRQQLTPDQRDKMLMAGQGFGRDGRHGRGGPGVCGDRDGRIGRGPGGHRGAGFRGDCPRLDDDD